MTLIWRKYVGMVFFRNFQRNVAMVDEEVRDRWFSQAREDIRSFRIDNRTMNNGPFARNLKDFLSGKYYWRDWVVVTYDRRAEGVDTQDMNDNDPNVWPYFQDRNRPERNLVVASTSEMSRNLLNNVRDIGSEFSDGKKGEYKSICLGSYLFCMPIEILCSADDAYENRRADFLVDYIPDRLIPPSPLQLGVALILVVETEYHAYVETDAPGRLYTKRPYFYCMKYFDVIVFLTQ